MLRRAVFLIIMIFSWPQAAEAAREFIDIYSPTARKIRLAIPEFRPQDTGRDPLGLKMAQVIESDLKRSGLFFIPNRKGYLENPMRAGIRRDEQRFLRLEQGGQGGVSHQGRLHHHGKKPSPRKSISTIRSAPPRRSASGIATPGAAGVCWPTVSPTRWSSASRARRGCSTPRSLSFRGVRSKSAERSTSWTGTAPNSGA